MSQLNNNFTTIYLVRHGETYANIDEIIDGQNVDADLTVAGEAQAAALAVHLEDVQFDAAFSSDLIRARKTAEAVALQKQLVVNTTELLRERYFAQFEGKTYDEYIKTNQHILEQLKQLPLETYFTTRRGEGVETEDEMYQRFLIFIREIAVTYSGKTVLVVSHGGIIRSVLLHLGWADHVSFGHGGIDNTAYVVLKTDGVEFEIGKINGIHKISDV